MLTLKCRDLKTTAQQESLALLALYDAVTTDRDLGRIGGTDADFPELHENAVQQVAAAKQALAEYVRTGGTLPTRYFADDVYLAWNQLVVYRQNADDVAPSCS
ncbi:hypothetical protein [Catellatospora tritici]|uniref:hypothetical protein n=1 Tax=Catellatospora tritici TaxID=2851566 RepID=UPI001C2D35EE|nr:hypothetical protein [Catellatospora tritici]MBV1856342.1 hypothetical protein [Catellatospora tritici]